MSKTVYTRLCHPPRTKDITEEVAISVGDYEFILEWHTLSSGKYSSVLRVTVFEDALEALSDSRIAPLWKWLAAQRCKNPQPGDVMDFMQSIGWTDNSDEHWRRCSMKWTEPARTQEGANNGH